MGMSANRSNGGYVAGKVIESDPKTAIFPKDHRYDDSGSGGKMSSCVIGKEDNPDYICYPYRLSRLRWVLMILIYILTGGFMWLMFYWRPDWKLKFSHYHTTFKNATSVFLEGQDGTNRVFVSEIKYEDSSVKKWGQFLFDTPITSEIQYSSTFENDHFRHGSVSSLENSDNDDNDADVVKYFYHHLLKYMWDERKQTFVKIEGYDGNVTFQFVHDSANEAISEENQKDMLRLFGENVIHVEVPSYFRLLVAEVLNPFYVFQMAACIFWMVDEYYAYATAIIIISFISAIISLITIRRERQSLHDMVELHNNSRITVVREIRTVQDFERPSSSTGASTSKEYVTEDIWIRDLVPGDIVMIPSNGIQLSFDAALISGTCIVNESMLTGESVPVTKTPLARGDTELGRTYKVDLQKSHTLFCGTEIIQTRYYQDESVRAVVVRTGFGTAKGQLVHSILFPKPVNLRLLRDAYRFVGVMCVIALAGFAYSTYIQIMFNASIHDILFKSLDIITITVPPALPLAMTIGIIYAQDRLKRVNIHTISPQRINICGQVDVVAFDKTGTLTEDGLDLTQVIPTSSDKFASLMPNELQLLDKKSELLRCMATCHSLTLIEGEVSGDPLDVKMLAATGWELVEPVVEETNKYDQLQTTYVRPRSKPKPNGDLITLSSEYDRQISGETESTSKSEYEVGIIRQFPFLSSLQRASVIAKPLLSDPTDMTVYVKGAPETIASLCQSVPNDFSQVLKTYTREGHRVIALSYKKVTLKWLKAQKIEREVLENDLNFLGFLILQNKLKPSSATVIRDLDSALLRNVMVTGDNLETAICVAKECKILKPNVPLLIANCNTTGEYPTLTWKRSEQSGNGRKSYMSSSEEQNLTDTIISMGDRNSGFHCQLAMTGHEFTIIREHFPKFVPAMAVQGAVFARMSPQNKTELMEELEAVEYHTLMCGDGANDCGALKRAHVGLSLSEFDASVAAPFTARMENGIASVPTLIREGRAALVTSFGMFKFMALYSMIQFTTVLLLYRTFTNLSDNQFLYIDLIIIDVVAITMSRNHAYKTLHWRKPPSSLVNMEMLTSLFLQILLQFGLQILPYLLVFDQCWYRRPTFINETDVESSSGTGPLTTTLHPQTTTVNFTNATTPDYSSCPALANAEQLEITTDHFQRTYETTTLVYVSSFMYLSVSVAFSQGKPFRTSIYKNRFFLGSLLILAGFTIFMMFGAPPGFDEFMDLWRIPDMKYMWFICVVIFAHFVLSVFIEMFFVHHPAVWRRIKKACACVKRPPNKKYKYIEGVLSGDLVKRYGSKAGDYHNEILTPSQYENQTIYSKIPISGKDSSLKTRL